TYLSTPKFLAKLAANGFKFNQMSDRNIRAVGAGKTPKELVELFRSRIDTRTVPPGPTLTWLGETIIHGEDVFRAIGPYRSHPMEHVLAVADFYKNNTVLINSKKRIEGLRLVATDGDWSTGTGPDVQGPAIALVL